LVIGATGMMGKEVIHHLTQAALLRDIRVVAAARDIQKATDFTTKGVEVSSSLLFPINFQLNDCIAG
jgi:uncharacterized protein YbjT (DUF2867 family)